VLRRCVTSWGLPRRINVSYSIARARRCAGRWNDISREHRRNMADNAELTCKELVEVVTDYVEGALVPAERARFEAHLATCSGCRVYLEQMRQTIALLGRLPEASLSDAARGELLTLFRHWRADGKGANERPV
jgi:anti-sigma factor RsiW